MVLAENPSDNLAGLLPVRRSTDSSIGQPADNSAASRGGEIERCATGPDDRKWDHDEVSLRRW
jgi:hypothetical protein